MHGAQSKLIVAILLAIGLLQFSNLYDFDAFAEVPTYDTAELKAVNIKDLLLRSSDGVSVNFGQSTHYMPSASNGHFALDNPLLLVLIMPLVGYVLIRTDGVKLNSLQLQRIFCYGFIIILTSMVLITPYAISSYYWPSAFAETLSSDLNDEQIATLEAQITTLGSQIEDIELQIEELYNQIFELEETSGINDNEIPTETNSTVEEQIAVLEAQITTLESQIEDLKLQIGELYNQVFELENTNYAQTSASTEENLLSSDPTPTDDVDTSVEATTSPSVMLNVTIFEELVFNSTQLELSTLTNLASYTNSTSASYTNSTSASYTNSTSASYTNSTSASYTNSTSASYTNSTSASYTNSTSASYTNSTSASYTNSTSASYTNSTSASYTNSTSVVPANVTFQVNILDTIGISTSLKFNYNEFVEPVVTLDIIDGETTNEEEPEFIASANADSNYLTINNENLNNELNQLTISTWIKPDYVQGDSVLTILSKEKSFLLSLNNNIPPEKMATFSAYNGISWTTVTGNIPVPDGEWTHIAAVIKDTQVSLYQNSIFLGTSQLEQKFSISSSGKLEPVPSEVATDYSDIIVGAILNTNDKTPNLSKQFWGLIDEVEIYKRALDKEEIYQIFADNYYSLGAEFNEQISNVNEVLIENYDLTHYDVSTDQGVNWTLEVSLSDEVENIAIEIPHDAKVLKILATESNQNAVPIYEVQQSSEGIRDNFDIEELNLENLEIIGSDQTRILVSNFDSMGMDGFVTIETRQILLASLVLVPEMLQEDELTKLLVIDHSSSKFTVVFETNPTYSFEEDLSTESDYDVKVTVGHDSALHYQQVPVCADIPEQAVELGVEFRLNLEIDGKIVDVTDDPDYAVESIDTNQNEIVDKMCWIVPQLSEKTFHIVADLTVINIQSFPIVGGQWEVRFTTLGQADLEIMVVGGTGWSDNNENKDLKLLQIRCGNELLQYDWVAGVVIVPNYTCAETGYETSKVLTSGFHHLRFTFGNDVEFAHNDANNLNVALICGNSACSDSNRDVPLKQHIEANHNVTPFNDDNQNFDVSPFDVAVFSESVSSPKTQWFKTERIGILTVEGHSYNELELAKDGSSGEGTNGEGRETNVIITDNTHYITQNFDLGEITVANTAGNTGFMKQWDFGQSEVKLLSHYASDTEIARLLVVDVGEELVDGTNAVDKRAFFGARYFNNLNDNGKEIFDRALSWASGFADKPVITSTNPVSPSVDTTPIVIGIANPNVDIRIFDETGSSGVLDTRISQGSDDAEEKNNGDVQLNHGNDKDLDIAQKEIGLRFQNINVPQGSTITKAYIQFTAQNNNEFQSAGVNIFAEDVDNAQTFTAADFDITSRVRTTASVDWFIGGWDDPGDAGSAQKSPDISSLVQEVIDRPGWSDDNSIAFMLIKYNKGDRDALTYDGNPDDAALLHIEFNDSTLGSTTADTNGDWSVETSPLSEGTHSIAAFAINAAGVASLPSDAIEYTVDLPNQPPVAQDDLISTDEDTQVDIDVLGNDSEVDGTLDASTVSIVSGSGPSNGAAIVNLDGMMTYHPDTNFNGEDSLRYTVDDDEGATSNEATVTITVNSINDAPVAGNDVFSTAQNTPLTISKSSLLSNDFDIDGDTLSITSIESETALLGSVADNGDGTLTYTPTADTSSPPDDTFEYTVSDGLGGTDIGTVTITIIPDEIEDTLELESPELTEEDLDDLGEVGATINGQPVTNENLPGLILADADNDEAIKAAIDDQDTISLDIALPGETSASEAIDSLLLPEYNVPDIPDIAVVLPAVATSQAGATNQFVSTPVLDKIVGGQTLILANDVLSEFGGITKLVTNPAFSSETDEAIVVALAPDPFGPTTPPELEDGASTIFLDIKTQIEDGVPGAYDFSQASNFLTPPELTAVIKKPEIDPETGAPLIPVNSETGCPQFVEAFFLDTVPDPDEWITEGVIVDQSSIQPVDSSEFCSVNVQLPHYSKFAIGGVKALALGALALGGGAGGDLFAPYIGSVSLVSLSGSSQGLGGVIQQLDLDSPPATLQLDFDSPPATLQVEPGEKISLRIDINESQGINDLEHVTLYTNIRGDEASIYDSDTYITFEKNQELTITDPNGFFSDVDFRILQIDAVNFVLEFDITFAKSMPTSDITILTWDSSRNVRDVTYENAISVAYFEYETKLMEKELIVSKPPIPDWVKSSADWWANNLVTDSDFTEGIEFLVNEGIITIPQTEVVSDSTQEIPIWVKNNAQWWADDLITEDDFISGIQWMVSNGIINLNAY